MKREIEAAKKQRELDLATIEDLSHVQLELEAMRAERDQAITARDAVATAHGALIVEAIRLKYTCDEAAKTIDKLNAAILQRMSARGVA
jgi:hypothetical protein